MAQAQKWVDEFKATTSEAMIFLVGNKVDLEDQRRVSKEEALKYAQANDIEYIETSAKANINIAQLFDLVARKIPKVEKSPVDDPIVVNPRKDSRGCC